MIALTFSRLAGKRDDKLRLGRGWVRVQLWDRLWAQLRSTAIDQFRYIKIRTWLRGLGE